MSTAHPEPSESPRQARHQHHEQIRQQRAEEPLTVHIGREELVIRQRYEVVSIANDILIGIWFVIGSILFFGQDTVTTGTWLFLIGSVQMLIRPVIRLSRRVHLGRMSSPHTESSRDF